MRKLCLICSFIMSVLVCGSVSAASAVQTFMLDNGLKLIVKPDHRAPVAVLQVWYKVGGAYEQNGKTGISHALEHMMFRGTDKYPDGKFNAITTEVGAQYNAATADDYTYYYEEFAKEHLPLMMELEADRMANLQIKPELFAKEIEVVKEERRMRYDNNAQSTAYERFRATAFLANPYHVMTIGWMHDLEQMTRDDLWQWYQQWYVPNNATVVVVGDVDPGHVLQLAKQYFGPISERALPERKSHQDPAELGTKTVTVNAYAQVPWLAMGYKTPSLVTAKEKWEPVALMVLSAILSDGDSSRLPSELVRGSQVAASASAGYDAFSLYSGQFEFYATPATGHSIQELQAAITKEIKRLQDDPVTMEELNRAKTAFISQEVYDQDSIVTQASKIGALESVGLPWQTNQQFIQQVRTLRPQQIQAVARKYLNPKRLTVAVMNPVKEAAHEEN